MLKTRAQTPQEFFDLCLSEVGLAQGSVADLKVLQPRPPFAVPLTAAPDTPDRAMVIAQLEAVRDKADALWKRGQPALNEIEARTRDAAQWQEWNREWRAWAGARRPAFFARAALALLGDRAALTYLLDQMRASDNLVFQMTAFDALQHATGRYLSETEVESGGLERGKLADWWRRWLAENGTSEA